MRESHLLQHIADRSADLSGMIGSFGEILVGPGDDTAVVRTPSGDTLLITVDQLILGRHLQPDAPIDAIARKAVARSVSDLAAMGGVPAWGLATALLPTNYAHGDELFDAMSRWARHWKCPLIGGDIATGPGPLSLSVTVAGTMIDSAKPVLRSGARAGDTLWLTGRIGGSLASGWHASFEPRLEAGQLAAEIGAHAMIDLSDGLGRDATRIGVASGVRLVMQETSLPMNPGCQDWRQAASDGEDYELLIVLPPELNGEAKRAGWRGPIGVVAKADPSTKPGATIVDARGTHHDVSQLGWDHSTATQEKDHATPNDQPKP